MKKFLTFLIALFFIQPSFSQDKVIDSLEIALKNQPDSTKIKTLKSLVYRYGNTNKEKHLSTINKGIILSKKINDKGYEGDFISELAYYHRKNDQIDSAFYYYKNAQKIFLKSNDSSKYYYVEFDFGNLKKDKGEYDTALQHFIEGTSYFAKQENEAGIKNKNIGQFNIGVLYTIIKDNQKAIKAFKDVLSSVPDIPKNRGLRGVSNLNLVGLYVKEKQLYLALQYAEEVKKMNPAKNTLAHLYSNIGGLYEEKNDYDTAIEYYQNMLSNFKDTEDNKGIITAYNQIGELYVKMKNLPLAEVNLLAANTCLKTTKNIASLQYNYDKLAELFERQKKYKRALSFKSKSIILKDSILGIEKQKAIIDLEVKYETEKTKQEAVIAKLESNKNRNLFIGAIAILGLFLVASIFYFGRLKATKKAELIAVELKETQKRLAIEKQYKDSELKALKAQMNPHFIFNALNSIQDYIVLNQKNLASDYLGKFADLIRNYLHFSDTGYISITDEVYNLNLYLELEKLRFEEQLEYYFLVDDTVNSDFIKIPTMLIQPYVENALKHGLLHKKESRNLSIKISKPSDKIVECIIEDNGVGREKSKEINRKREAQHKSFALKATTERLDLLNYGKEQKIGVKIIDLIENDKATGTKVILNIPILKK